MMTMLVVKKLIALMRIIEYYTKLYQHKSIHIMIYLLKNESFVYISQFSGSAKWGKL